MIPWKNSLWLHASVPLSRADQSPEQRPEAGSGEATMPQELFGCLCRGIWGHLWPYRLTSRCCSRRVCCWTGVLAELSPWYPQVWAPGLLCLCRDCPMWVKLSFSLTFILYLLCSFINNPRQIQGSKSRSLYPVIFTAFQKLPGRSRSLSRLPSSSPQNPYNQLGNCSIVFKFALYTQQSRNSCFCFWWCTWSMLGNSKW